MPPVKRVVSHRWQPDLIAAIDFGMTCTGVVYVKINPGSTTVPEIKQIKRWPGARDHVLEKVPTELIYSADNNTVQFWGAECKRELQEIHRTKRWFKLDVSAPATNNGFGKVGERQSSGSDSTTTLNDHHADSARRYFKDYIAQVVSWVDQTFADQVPHYNSLNTEYILSIPTSWSLETSTLQTIASLMRDAVGESDTRRARVGLTEAAAAAIESGRDSSKKGDITLVCDTGGGTCDINIFKFISSEKEPARIKALTYDEGANIGSTRIDQLCLDYIRSRIDENIEKDAQSFWLKHTEEAVRQNFPELKHSFGDTPSTKDAYYLPIRPSYYTSKEPPSSDFQAPKDGLGPYEFKIPARQMQKWFDDQIDSITSLIDKQISTLQAEHKREKISRVVLSGGFALNKYYRTQLRSYFKERIRAKDRGISDDLEILNAAEPHLAVVRGLIYNRWREVAGLGPTYESVVSPTSFGFVVSERYSKFKHAKLGEVPVTSALDGKQWIRGQIDWVIEEGVAIPSKGLKKEYDIVLSSEDESALHSFQVVRCNNPRENLPQNISHTAVAPVCEIRVDVSKLPVERRKSRLSFTGSKDKQSAETRETRFDLWILVGAAELRFELKPRGVEDALISLEHDQIDIAWADPQEKTGEKSQAREISEVKSDFIVKKGFRQMLNLRQPSFN